jgi:hypothetical protein
MPPPTTPARVLEIPEGFLLSNEEIARVLSHFNKIKAAGGDCEIREHAEGYEVLVPVSAVITRDEVVVAVTKLNQAKASGDAEVLFTFSRGEMVKRGWVLLKHEGNRRRLTSGGTRPKEY